MEFTLGADPEWFLTDGTKPVSAIGKIGGTKKEPMQLLELPKGYSLQEDNVTVEYNIPPAKTYTEWVYAHDAIQSAIKQRLKKLNLQPMIVGSVVMPMEELMNPKAWEFGCDPDFNAWTLEQNPPPESKNINLRAAGGHIHVGCRLNNADKVQLVRVLDLYVGLPLMIADPDTQRQQLYGKAGAFRFKSYGIEYRVPSNFWTKSYKLIQYVWDQVAQGTQRLDTKVPREVKDVLDSGDKAAAKEILGTMGVRLCPRVQ